MEIAKINIMIAYLGTEGIFVVNTKTSRARAARPIKVSARETFLKNSTFTFAVFGIILIDCLLPSVHFVRFVRFVRFVASVRFGSVRHR